MAATTSLYRKQTFKPLEDFEFLGIINDVPMTLLGSPKLPANTYRDFESYIRTNGGNGIIVSVADAPNAVANASIVGNRVSGAATVTTGTTQFANGNILLDSVGWTVELGPDPPVVTPGQGILNVRAANVPNLRGLNFNTTVQDLPADAVDGDGNIIVPPPPFYDPALYVPLPPN